MILLARIIVGIVGLLALGFLLYSAARLLPDPIGSAMLAVLFSVAVLGLWFGMVGHKPIERGKIKLTLIAGLTIGIVGFLLGFVGPMILTPGANQGPLLCIFITGPLGFALGCFGGFVWTRFIV